MDILARSEIFDLIIAFLLTLVRRESVSPILLQPVIVASQPAHAHWLTFFVLVLLRTASSETTDIFLMGKL